MNMHNPPHPGEVIRDLCLEPLGLTVTDAANALGVSRKMALRLSKAFSTTPESWLNQQVHYDLWNAKKHSKGIKVKKLYAA
jgi:plasmid maintenance system antidote protein VapI